MKPQNESLDFQNDELSFVEMLDHILTKGLVVTGDVTISVANVDLIYLGLNLLVGSVPTIEEAAAKTKDGR